MDTKLLEDALALLEEGNLSRAAARRHVTQPAFSRRIRALEDWVGHDLLERRANRITIAPALASAAEELRSVLERIEHLRRALEGGGAAQRLVCATQHALAVSVVPTMFASFGADIEWRLRTLNREDCVSLFLHGEADILAIYEERGFPPLPFDATIRRHVWMRDTLIPVVGGDLRYQLTETGLPPDPIPYVRYPADSHFGRLLENRGLEDSLKRHPLRVVIESAFTWGIAALVAQGAGIGWIPHNMCRAELASGALISLSAHLGAAPLDISLFCSSGNAAASALFDGL
jgi:DNA-binding transcriptional LysR family regulator